MASRDRLWSWPSGTPATTGTFSETVASIWVHFSSDSSRVIEKGEAVIGWEHIFGGEM